MPGTTLDMFDNVNVQALAEEISRKWDEWKGNQTKADAARLQLRDDIFAVDTSTTDNSSNGFANNTHIPKLMSIAQNLHANYFDHVLGEKDWFAWQAQDEDPELAKKAKAILAYMSTKVEQQNMVVTLSRKLWDWILGGDCFSQLAYMTETTKDAMGNKVPGYTGPKLFRISPNDIVYNLAAASFEQSPKIIRKLISFGELIRLSREQPETSGWSEDLAKRVMNRRHEFRVHGGQIDKADLDKAKGYIADGFTTIQEYYESELVEILTFYGDFYDGEKNELLENHTIVVVDRMEVIYKEPINSWNGTDYIYHDAWTERPDNLAGIGPLDNLAGMQYKLDKLENQRADVWDEYVNPTRVEHGDVEFHGLRGAPGGTYVVEDATGGVEFLRPDFSALQADNQIERTLSLMEEMAGSPREANGFRTPGEKTKFEVQLLDNGANRVFRHKTKQFERMIERILDDMHEMARRNLDGSDIIRSSSNEFGLDEFLTITREDISATGKFRARGSSIFIEKANKLQTLNTVYNGPLGEMIKQHTSSIKLAEAIEDAAGFEKHGLITKNIGIQEDADSQRLANQTQQAVGEEDQLDLQEGQLDESQDLLP